MSQKNSAKGAVQAPRSGGKNTVLITVLGLVFTTGVGFAVGYTIGKKKGQEGLQAVQLVASKEKPKPPPAPERKEPDDPLKAPKTQVDVPAESPVKGPASAPITIVEFSEFQCPFCSRGANTVRDVMKEYEGKVRVVFRHKPLPFHKEAPLASEASMAANEQGKFWEYHDKLFANQKALFRADLEKYAEEVGLDMPKFKAALDSRKFKAFVEKDEQSGEKLGVSGTPTFFINGRKLVGAQPPSEFKKVIEHELKGG